MAEDTQPTPGLIAALLRSDDLRDRYERSGAFYHGVNRIAAFAAWAVDGLAAESDATDAKFEEHRRLMERDLVDRRTVESVARPLTCSEPTCYRAPVWERVEHGELHEVFCHAHATLRGVSDLTPIPGRGPS